MTDLVPAELLRIAIRSDRHRKVRLLVAGEIDLATAGQLQTAILAVLAAADRPAAIDVDLFETTFLDASGIRVLLEGHHAATRAGVEFMIRNPRGAVVRVLRAAGVADYLKITPPVAPL